jgi:hypothetical protein
MSDANLLVFGCVVSFVAFAGAYVYLREGFTPEERPSKSDARHADAVQARFKDVA